MTREQFTAHVQSTQEAFRRYLLALCCGDGQLADDIAQEAYIKAFLASEQLTSPDKFSAWLFRIGYNTFLNTKRNSHVTVDYANAAQIEADTAADGAFRYQKLYQSLAQITVAERSAILLFYMQGYSIKEIAAIEYVSTDAVKQYLSRGRKHLAEFMKNAQND